ncbi:MAG: SDR family oxidoreductase [Arcticibacter sp.]
MELQNGADKESLSGSSFLVTGGAGFIGSSLVAYLLNNGARRVRVLDNFSTGFRSNLDEFSSHPGFELIEGDIRDLQTCRDAAKGMRFVFHEAALGSVPRSIHDPVTTNEVNISGFLNMLVAARDEGVKRMVYAASSSTYGDSVELPKVEDRIGRPLSPYAVTKYVNELYADVFARTYGMELIGLRYFNVFGPKQNPAGAYAAVIPKFIEALMNHESPVINGDGEYSRDFTYIDNVIQMNMRAVFTDFAPAVNQTYNVAFGQQTSLNELTSYLKRYLCDYDPLIANVPIEYGQQRLGDIPHSLASIDKAQQMLDYSPRFSVETGLQETVRWFVKKKELATIQQAV